MTTPLRIGTYHTVYVGPIIAEDDNQPETVAHDAAGIKVELTIGDAAPVDITSSLTDSPGDYYWREVGSLGVHALDLPDTVFVEGNVGKMLRLDGVATGVYPFGNRESLMVVDPAYIEELVTMIVRKAFGDVSLVPDYNANPPTWTFKLRSTDETIGVHELSLVERDAVGAMTAQEI